MTLSENIIKDITKKLEEKNTNIDFFRDQILTVDAEKSQYDNAINILDGNLLSKIEEVNNTLYDTKDAYQDRINVGCRTDLFWRVVGFSTGNIFLGTFNTFTLRCTKLSLSAYQTVESESVGTGDTSYGNTLSYYDGTQQIDYSFKNLLGWIDDNLHGIKYYDEPIAEDIGNTTVGSFIGTVGTATTTLTVMVPFDSGIGDLFKVDQLVISSKAGVFPQSSNRIVGIETGLADLSDVSVGIGTTVVNILILDDIAISDALAPEPDGSFVTFTVLDDPDNISNVNEYSIPFEKNPFSPQTIGIMNSDNIGIGRNIVYDNSGNLSNSQSWKPENAIQGVEDVPDVIEPSVGAGKIYYKVGFNQRPINPDTGLPAIEGETISIFTLDDIYEALPSCPTQETNLTNAINVRNAKETEFANELGEFSILLQASSALRNERDIFNSRIWGLRQSIGGEIDEIDRYSALETYIKSSTVNNIIN
jgi:hypothetical protein